LKGSMGAKGKMHGIISRLWEGKQGKMEKMGSFKSLSSKS